MTSKILVPLLVIACACSQKSRPEATTPPATEATKTPAAGPPGEPPYEVPVVTLVTPGAEPRRELRFRVSKGQTGQLVMIMRFNIDIAVGGKTLTSAKLPPMRMAMDMRVTDVAANGDIRYEFVLGESRVLAEEGSDPNVVQAMQAPLDGMKGIVGHVVVSNRGITKGASFEVPERADPAMRQTLNSMKDSMRQMSAPFPEEPIGVGGRWQSKSIIHSNGMKLEQTAHYELTSMSGDELQTKIGIEQSAGPQQVALPSAPGSTMELVSLSGKGVGRADLHLQKLTPVAADVSVVSDMRANIDAGNGTKQEMTMRMEMSMQMGTDPRAKDPKAPKGK